MEKAILKVRLKKPIDLGLCPKPRFGGTVEAGALATRPSKRANRTNRPQYSTEHWADQPKLVTSNSKSVTYVLNLKCYLCPDHTPISAIGYWLLAIRASAEAIRPVGTVDHEVILPKSHSKGRADRFSRPYRDERVFLMLLPALKCWVTFTGPFGRPIPQSAIRDPQSRFGYWLSAPARAIGYWRRAARAVREQPGAPQHGAIIPFSCLMFR